MRLKSLVAALALATPAVGQMPAGPTAPVVPERGDVTVKLPSPETRVAIDPGRLAVIRGRGLSWQLVSGAMTLRDFGQDLTAAEELFRAMRDLKATTWVTIGPPERPVLEYGLTDGRANTGVPRDSSGVPLDSTLRVERLRGVWVLRTAGAVVANFGSDRASAEQALAAIRRYGFNHAGTLGRGSRGAYLYYAPPAGGQPVARPAQALAVAVAGLGETLTRTGVAVPGTDEFVGERVVIEPRAAEVTRAGSQYHLTHRGETLHAFGNDEWSARDALAAVQRANLTDVCRVAGLTFYLSHGRPPSYVGLGTRQTRFQPDRLRVVGTGGRFLVTDPAGVRVAEAQTQADAEVIVKIVRGYEFDTLCVCGGNPRTGFSYLARTGW